VAVVLSEGRTESLYKYREFIFELYQQGYSIYSADHRGQGASGRLLDDSLKGHVEEFADYVADTQQFLDTVVVPNAGKNLFLIGHSMGAAINIFNLAANPELFKAAVMSAPMLEANLGLPAGCSFVKVINLFCNQCSTPNTEYETREEAFANNKVTHSFERYDRSQTLFEKKPEIALSAPTFGWVNQACGIRSALLDAVKDIRTPILLLQAGGDKVVKKEPQNRFCSLKNNAGHSVCEGGEPFVIEGAYHEIFFEEDAYRETAMAQMFALLKRYR